MVALRTAEPHRAVISDAGGTTASLRVTWHAADGLFSVTFWDDRRCVASVKVSPEDAADLVVVFAEGLADALPDWVATDDA
jgi:hypothetical protein